MPESVELELFLLRATGESHPLCEGEPPFTKGEAGGDGDNRSSLSKSLSAQEFGERLPGNGTWGSVADGLRGGGGTPLIGALLWAANDPNSSLGFLASGGESPFSTGEPAEKGSS